jgi:CheY-like chemotaxis protein
LLLVDDEDATRSALARWFERDYDVAIARDGNEGLAAATAFPPDVIIADVWMPRLDGIEMISRIRGIAPLAGIPVVFLTGQTGSESVAACLSAGAVSYLSKPVDLDLLEREVIAALATRSWGSQTTTELKSEYKKSLDLMRTLRDEVRMKLHLAGMDAKDEWRKLEPRLAELEKAGTEFTEATCKVASELVQRLSKLRSSII